MSLWMLETPPPPADSRLSYGADEFNFGDLRLPKNTERPYPLVIVVHGGFWRAAYNLEHIGHVCADLTERGLATWSIEYRRIGNEGGGYPGTLQDVAKATDYLRELAPAYQLDLNRVIVIGHSAGGHLAFWLAGRSRLAAESELYKENPLPLKTAISLAGVTNLRQGWDLQLSKGVVGDFIGGTPTEFPERYDSASPAELLPLGTPQILIHGIKDENVPFILSEDYSKQAQAAGDQIELLTLPDAAHFEVIDPKSAEWPLIVEAIFKALNI